MLKRIKILIQGRVQGVGCRPFIYRLACKHQLTGFVCNTTEGVAMEAQGNPANIDEFVSILKLGKSHPDWPPLMQISSLKQDFIKIIESEPDFTIRKSESPSAVLSHVTADSATCRDCLAEMNDPADFRYRYPFINCTNCGPRYSIIQNIPYDRGSTTMSEFTMCPKCAAQYADPNDRRFHAQPVACPDCGPTLTLLDSKGRTLETDSDQAIKETAQILIAGKIAAIKGIGGFHLVVDAKNENAVKLLRQRKHRDHKPLAMMAADMETIRKYAKADKTAESILTSPESPIVLLEKLKSAEIAPSVAPGVSTFGFMLCYSPLHHLLFAENGIEVLVMTSANHSDEPLICKNDEALSKIGDIADVFLMHNREIFRQVDDSVVQVIADEQAMLRRSRGYVPRPILTQTPVKKHIFAAGADLKNTFCLAKDNQYIISEHIGDLADSRVYRHYIESIKHLQKLIEIEPAVFACDLHPSYISTQYVRSQAERSPDIEVIEIQHHWAHIASVLAEYQHPGPVIGLIADGTGYGTDTAVWGCECLIASLTDFTRFGHLKYFPLAGGDTASKEALRPLMGLLNELSTTGGILDEFGPLLKKIEPDPGKLRLIETQIAKRINTVSTSSMGRLFDAAAVLTGLGSRNRFDAELPMALESIAAKNCEDFYSIGFIKKYETAQLDHRIMLRELILDIENDVQTPVISAKFHNWAANSMLEFAKNSRKQYNLNTVALAGGVFCNRYLTNRTIELLKKNNFLVLYKKQVPANDGGISLGQAAIAAQKCK